MFVSPAYAQAAAPGGGEMFVQFLPLVLIFVVFYFLLIRPQQKKAKQHREMLSALRRGDRIVTGGGIIGRVARIEGDSELFVEIAPEVRVRVLRSTVAEVLSKTEPADRGGGEIEETQAREEKPKEEKREAKAPRKSRGRRSKATAEKSG